jgi:hypothetical protein
MSSPFQKAFSCKSPLAMHHWSPETVRSARGGNTVYVTGDQGGYEFHENPQYDGHEPSSHLMSDDNKKTAWPAIYRDEAGSWSNQSMEQARKRNELYDFNDNETMVNFARKGNWKQNKNK